MRRSNFHVCFVCDIAGSSDFYDGRTLAATQNVVVVVINYRVGPFGWLVRLSLY